MGYTGFVAELLAQSSAYWVMASIGRRGGGAQTRRFKQLEFSLWLSKG
jgi:hypothetical protein